MKQCPQCGWLGNVHSPTCTRAIVSVADDSLDPMIEAASVPNLATLFRRAKDKGVIGSVSNYGEAS